MAPGPAGMEMSPVAAGLWRLAQWGFTGQALATWIEAALDHGITTFDHADIYGAYTAEAHFGRAMALHPGLRDRLQIVTKCGIKLVSAARPTHRIKSYDSSRAHVIASVEHSLRALQTDRIDCLLIHRPDALLEPDELAQTFDDLKAAGKVLAFGVSNHTPDVLAIIHRRHGLQAHQVEFSALQMRALADGTLTQCLDLGLRPMAWSPLAGGRLTQGEDEQARRVRGVLAGLANLYGVGLASIAYAWVQRHPSRPVVITGSHRIEALREAVAATQIDLTREDWTAVWQASMGQELP